MNRCRHFVEGVALGRRKIPPVYGLAMTEEHGTATAAWLKTEVEKLENSRWLGHLDDLRLAAKAVEAGMIPAEVAALMSAPVRQIELWLAEAKGRTLGWEEVREAELRAKLGRPEPMVPDVVEELGEYLPIVLIASLAGVKDASQVKVWALGTVAPTPAAVARLHFALKQARRIAGVESAKVATAWLTTACEPLGGALPLKAIREDHFEEVTRAVSAFLDGYSG